MLLLHVLQVDPSIVNFTFIFINLGLDELQYSILTLSSVQVSCIHPNFTDAINGGPVYSILLELYKVHSSSTIEYI